MNNLIRKINYQVFFVIIIFSSLYSQQTGNSDEAKKDSVFRYQGINPALNIWSDFYDFYFPFEIPPLQSNKLIEGDNSTIWLRTKVALSYSSTFKATSIEIPDDLMLPLYNQYLEDSKSDPVRYVLGIVQLGAVGYLAYKHIKKYGFWK